MYPKTVRVVYAGWITLTSKKPGVELKVLGEGDSLTDVGLYFERKMFPAGAIGGVYEMEQTGEVAFRVSGRRYVGMYHDTSAVAGWQLLQKAAAVLEQEKQMEKKAKECSELLFTMEPLRKVYKTALPDRKRAIEVILLNYLRN